MDAEQELRTLSNIILFVKRTTLSGEEVAAFNESMQYLGARHQGLTAMLDKQKRDADEDKTPAGDE